LFFALTIIKCVFFTFKDYVLQASQFATLQSSWFTDSPKIFISLWLKSKLVSSANNKNERRLELCEMSFTYIKNNKGPRADPCGTPQLTTNVSEFTDL